MDQDTLWADWERPGPRRPPQSQGWRHFWLTHCSSLGWSNRKPTVPAPRRGWTDTPSERPSHAGKVSTMELIITMRHGYFSTKNEHTSPTREEALASLSGYTITRELRRPSSP